MTLGQVLRETVQKHGDRPAFVTVGKDATRLTYREVWDRVSGYAGVLRDRGVGRGDRVCLISENCPEWALMDWACQCLGAVLVPIYATLPADQAEYIVRDCGARLVVANGADQMRKVECIEGVEPLALRGEGSLDERAKGAQLDPRLLDAEIDAAEDEDPCTIIYTSGTTGKPKGAVMPHRAFVHVAWSVSRHLAITHEDSFFSFLPLSHVFERVAGHVLPVYLGSTICFSRGLAFMAKEMAEFAPQVVMVVPRFLENLRDRVLDAAAKEKPLRQKLFALMLSQGTRRAQGKFAPLAGILDRLVAVKVRARLGGRVRFLVSGGAALPPPVAEFYMAVGITVLQGYGLTETSGGSIVNRPANNRYWTVGEPLDMEFKIAEDGEILMRGPGIMLGYFNLPEETAQAIDAEGWFHTGDIGEFEGKNLKITDRKKDIIVLGNGKNVAPQAIEGRLKTSPYIQEAVVLGDGMDHCVALIVPAAEAVRKAIGLPDDAPVTDNDGVHALIKREVDRINRTMASYEAIKKFAVLDHAFTIEGGELTPSMKVKRNVVKERYADQIARLVR